MPLNFNSNSSSWWFIETFRGSEAEILKFIKTLRDEKKNDSAELLFPVVHEVRKQEVYNTLHIKGTSGDLVDIEIHFKQFNGAQAIIDALKPEQSSINTVPNLIGNYFSEVIKKYKNELRLLRKIRLMIKLMEGSKDETR